MHIPDDIISNILSRLSAKPLLRCKCVSKHWNHLISNPNFIESRSHHMILLPVFPLQSIEANIAADDTANSMLKLCCPYGQLNNNIITIVGAFKGIVFMVIKSYLATHMILHNPFTAMYKVIPHPPTSYYSNYAHGFGYGSTPDDLKIVRIEVNICSRELVPST